MSKSNKKKFAHCSFNSTPQLMFQSRVRVFCFSFCFGEMRHSQKTQKLDTDGVTFKIRFFIILKIILSFLSYFFILRVGLKFHS